MDKKKILKKLGVTLIWFLLLAFVISTIMSMELPTIVIVVVALAAPVLLGYIFVKIDGEASVQLGVINFFMAFIFLVIFTEVVPYPFKDNTYSDDDYNYTDDLYADNDDNMDDPYVDNGENIDDSYVDDNDSIADADNGSYSGNDTDISGDMTSDNNDVQADMELTIAGSVWSIEDINSLNGYFVLNLSDGTLTEICEKLSHEYNNEIARWDGKELDEWQYIYYTDYLPTVVDRTKGEKLVLVGKAWSGRSEKRKKAMEYEACKLIGYGNPYLLSQDMKLSDFQTVCGIDVSEINDTETINKVLDDTTFSFHIYSDLYIGKLANMQNDLLVISSEYGATFTYGSFSGTEFITQNVAMITPFYTRSQKNTDVTIPIEITMDGYAEVDISSLESGVWLINDTYPVMIK